MKRTAVLLLLAVLGACGGGDGSPTTSSSSTTTTSRASEERAVIEAYLAQIDAFYAAANPPNPDHLRLAETATGPLLESVRANLADLAARGVGIRKGEQTTNNPRVTRLTSTAAVVEDCSTDADVQFRIETNEVVDEAVSFGRLTARLVKRGEKWLVESKSVVQLSEPCGE